MGKLVGTSTSHTATGWPPQRKSFYAAGRFWVFYSDGTNIVYRTSTDGINWVEPITIRTCNQGHLFSIWFDETYVHYAYSSAVGNTPLYYRRGTPESDGSITWSAVEQQAVAGAVNVQYWFPVVSVDSEGYPWIGYGRSPDFYPYATISDNNDGTWSGAETPSQLSTVSAVNIVSVIPLTEREMLAVYARGGNPVNARLWDGAAPWGDEISTNNAIVSYHRFSAVAEGNDVHLVFTNSSNRLTYAKYDYSSNSFIDEKLLTGTYIPAPPVISIDENNDLLVFWGGYPAWYNLYYLRYTSETDTWGPAVKWKTEEQKIYGDSLTCFYNQNSGYTGLAYTTNPYPGPYAVKFNYVAPPPPPGVPPAPDEPGSPGAPEPTAEPEVVSNTLTSGGSRHTTPEQGSVGTKLSARRTRISRHITWVPVVIVRA